MSRTSVEETQAPERRTLRARGFAEKGAEALVSASSAQCPRKLEEVGRPRRRHNHRHQSCRRDIRCIRCWKTNVHSSWPFASDDEEWMAQHL